MFCLALSAIVKTMAFTLRDMGTIDNLSRGVIPASHSNQISLAVVLKIGHRERTAEAGRQIRKL